jgi:hypothetical protein
MNRVRHAVLGLGCLLAFSGSTLAQQLDSAAESKVYVHHEILLADKAYTPENLLPIARDFVSRFLDRPFAVLRIAPDRDALIGYDGKGITDPNFANWAYRLQRFIQSGQEPIPTIAEVNLVDGEAVLRIRNSGKVSRVVLTARDPLFVEHGGRRFEILEISGRLVGPPGAEREGLLSDPSRPRTFICPNCTDYIYVYVRAQWPMERKTVDALAARLGSLGKEAVVYVFVRPDSCFAEYTYFPFLYAFEETFRIPTEEEYGKTPRMASFYDPPPKER